MSVVVVGSINQDLLIKVPRYPQAGETVLGHGHLTGPGGKGANQAVAASRLGADVAFFGRAGNDPGGREMRRAMGDAGIDVRGLGLDPDAATGLAIIAIDDGGENAIIVSPGANAHFLPAHLEPAAAALDQAEVTLLQLEIPLDSVQRAVELAGNQLLLNPAPARPLPAQMLAAVDVLIPNQSELGILAGVPEPRSIDDSVAAAARITGPGAVIVTMGADGALVVTSSGAEHVPTPEVAVVDTTGAGDAFCGALAEALARGEQLMDAVSRAVVAGAAATTKVGAQSALPFSGDLDAPMGAGKHDPS